MLNDRTRIGPGQQQASPSFQKKKKKKNGSANVERRFFRLPCMHRMEVMQSGLNNLELGSNEFSGQKSARYQKVALDAGDSSILESEAGGSQIQG